MKIATIALLASLVGAASASLFVTFPVATTSIAAGERFDITWLADETRERPLASAFGRTTISLFTGSQNVQVSLGLIGEVDDPSEVLSLRARISRNVGPNSDKYFLRFESTSVTDEATGFPLQAFSARFTLTGMAGEFSPEAVAANAGVVNNSSAPSGAPAVVSTGMTSLAIASGAGGSTATAVVSSTLTSGRLVSSTSTLSQVGISATSRSNSASSTNTTDAAVALGAGKGFMVAAVVGAVAAVQLF